MYDRPFSGVFLRLFYTPNIRLNFCRFSSEMALLSRDFAIHLCVLVHYIPSKLKVNEFSTLTFLVVYCGNLSVFPSIRPHIFKGADDHWKEGNHQ